MYVPVIITVGVYEQHREKSMSRVRVQKRGEETGFFSTRLAEYCVLLLYRR
jgi:hypothetical protein